MSIYIFSRPIHSGKTTALLQWSNHQINISGILMPDINGSRKIVDLKTKEIFDIECIDALNTTEPLTSVGGFHFYTAAFDKANSILINALTQKPDWLVIDEAGRLELEGRGFYKSIMQAVDLYNNANYHFNLLLTVRDSLCEEVISFFKIKNYTIIQELELIK
jgi:nucleoside-triphosphatase THEP1